MKETADRLEIPLATYREWEYGRSIQGTEPYIKLAALFSVGIAELITGTLPPQSEIWKTVEAIEKHLLFLKEQLRA